MANAPKDRTERALSFSAEVAVSVRSGARSERVRCRAERAPPDSPHRVWRVGIKNFLPRSYLGCMRCFLGSGQKAMQAMLSISRTYEHC